MRKQNKTMGKSYVSAKSRKVINAKQLGPVCNNCRCKYTDKFSEEVRQGIFDSYYDHSMTYERQQDFICQHIDKKDMCQTCNKYSDKQKLANLLLKMKITIKHTLNERKKPEKRKKMTKK